MLCTFLKSVPLNMLFTHDRIAERIELETPQIIYLIRCEVCKTMHSIEFSVGDEEPQIIANGYKQVA